MFWGNDRCAEDKLLNRRKMGCKIKRTVNVFFFFLFPLSPLPPPHPPSELWEVDRCPVPGASLVLSHPAGVVTEYWESTWNIWEHNTIEHSWSSSENHWCLFCCLIAVMLKTKLQSLLTCKKLGMLLKVIAVWLRPLFHGLSTKEIQI